MEVNDQPEPGQTPMEAVDASLKEFHLATVFMVGTFNAEAEILEKKAAELRQRARAMSTIRDGLKLILTAGSAQQKELEGA